ncbi:glycosyltransferase family A protein [Mariniflexile soesokkakense]|uniref:Glycosyltransferase family A protein n=1 Tax=Mariniflexile soesokkakense TaxID=1343160 RepID=A0ABV0A6G4_9FLAO
MIYLIHENNNALKVLNSEFVEVPFSIDASITKTLFKIAEAFPNDTIIWCHQTYQAFINSSVLNAIFHHQNILASYSVSHKYYIPDSIGYIDQSVFLNVKKDVTYPTWLMSSDVGGVSTGLLNSVAKSLNHTDAFEYFLNSLAKAGMIQGVFCYSEPALLNQNVQPIVETKQASNIQLFKFVKEHYKWVWVYMLAFCFAIYERKLKIIPLINTFFQKRLLLSLKEFDYQSKNIVVTKKEIDVIIPTIGRTTYLHDVLKDLATQSVLPKNVIIIEQNPLPDSVSELDFITTENWPFNIKHTFTNQTGVCNARNLALNQIESEWVFLNDDDNRFNKNLIESVFKTINKFDVLAITTAYLQENESLLFTKMHQTGIFGSGNSFVKASCLKNIRFDMALEFGYGEDFDFGMQLRNEGVDVVYCPYIRITHLKAPFGGFRTEVKQLWDNNAVQPKPSPTIMYTFLKHYTKKQLLNYKLVLFLRLIKKESIFNYWSFYKNFQKKWQASIFWAKKL